MEGLLTNVADRAADFRMGLEEIRQKHSCVVRVRSKGLLLGVQLSIPAGPVVAAALKRGLILNATQETVIRMLPPYIVTEAEVKEALQILDEVLPA
jgi:acetylornithine/succinyldiaminopimelate/putrescine aminotransferase